MQFFRVCLKIPSILSLRTEATTAILAFPSICETTRPSLPIPTYTSVAPLYTWARST